VEIPITIGLAGLTTHELRGVQDPGITTFKHYPTTCCPAWPAGQHVQGLHTAGQISVAGLLNIIDL